MLEARGGLILDPFAAYNAFIILFVWTHLRAEDGQVNIVILAPSANAAWAALGVLGQIIENL